MSEFKVGDIVEAWGVRGEVFKIVGLYVYVNFPSVNTDTAFCLSGREYTWHKEPTLKFIERKKVYKEVVMECFGNIYESNINLGYNDERLARTNQAKSCLNPTNKKIKITYYVEEEG